MDAGNGTAPSPAPGRSTSDIVHASNLSTCMLVVLVMSWSIGGHHLASRCRYMTEGSAACALGFATGLILLIFHHYLNSEIVQNLLEFSAASFFTYLLPPVIFFAGLSVEKSHFFAMLPSILMYGVLGTLASFVLISLFLYGALGFALFKLEDCLAMGAIFAATDSVATLQVLDRSTMPVLHALVFGEGVINDAVSVVLLGAVASTAHSRDAAAGAGGGGGVAGGLVARFVYLLVTSLLLGGAAGLAIAWALKALRLNDAHQELATITLLSYLSYLLADVTGLSAILSLFVCGVVTSHYAMHSLSPEGRVATLTGFRTASYLAEGVIFIYLGMDALDPLKWQGANAAEALWLVLVLTALLVAARAAFVVPFSILHNMMSGSEQRLSARDIVVVWWAGLMRGAVSVALVYFYFDDNPRQVLDRARATLIVSTLMVVLLSVLGFGALTKPLLEAMLGSSRDTPIIEQLRSIPLLGNLARDSSHTSLLLERVENSLRGGGTPRYSHLRTGSGGSGGGPAGGGLLPWFSAGDGGSRRGAGPAPGFAGFDASEGAAAAGGGAAAAEAGRAGATFVREESGPSFAGYLQQQQQQLGGVPAQLELQQQPGGGGNSSVRTAMQQLGEAWDAFDRSVMQPAFGGPGQPGQPPQLQQQQQQHGSGVGQVQQQQGPPHA